MIIGGRGAWRETGAAPALLEAAFDAETAAHVVVKSKLRRGYAGDHREPRCETGVALAQPDGAQVGELLKETLPEEWESSIYVYVCMYILVRYVYIWVYI